MNHETDTRIDEISPLGWSILIVLSLAVMGLVALATGCSEIVKPPPVQPSTSLTSGDKSAASVDTDLGSVKVLMTSLAAHVDVAGKEILASVNAVLDDARAKNSATAAALAGAEQDRVTAAKAAFDDHQAQQRKIADLESAKNSKLNAGLTWFVLIGIALVAGGVALGWYTQLPLSKYIGRAGAVLSGVALGTIFVLHWEGIVNHSVAMVLPWFMIALGAILIGTVIYVLWTHRKAFTQIVATTEAAKNALAISSPMAKATIFDDKGTADQLQSDSTKAIVSAVKTDAAVKDEVNPATATVA